MTFIDYVAIAGWAIVVIQNVRRVAEFVVGLVDYFRGLKR